jgi:predicted nuclease of predicted toxin-antitoxin system
MRFMASFKFLLDNDVRHLSARFPNKQTVQLEDISLDRDASDEDIVAAASQLGYVIVTNNRRDFEHEVRNRVAETSSKKLGCTQVHGLVIVLPLERLKQERAIDRASKQLRFQDKPIGWKDVNELCLKVVIEESGRASVTKLPRCPHCTFRDDES